MHARIIIASLTIAIVALIAVPAAAAPYRLPVRGTVSFQFAQSPDPDAGIYDPVDEQVSYRFTGFSRKGDRPLTQVTYSYHHESYGGSAPGAGDCVEHFVEDAEDATASAHTQWGIAPRDPGHAVKLFIPSVQVPVNTSTTYSGDCPGAQNRSGGGVLTLPLVRFTLTQDQLRSAVVTGTVTPDVPLVEDWLDLGSTPLSYQIQTKQQKTAKPHPRSGCARSRITVYFAVNTAFHPEKIGRKYGVNRCWLWVRPRPAKGLPARCEQARGAPSLWAYNEVASAGGSYAPRDQTSIKACYLAVPREQRRYAAGAAYFAYDQDQNHWETTGHIPKRVGRLYGLLELYGGGPQHRNDIVTRTTAGDALSTWEHSYRRRFGAVVNIGGIGSDAQVAAVVKHVCQKTPGKVMGLYAGSGEKARLTARRLKAVWQAMKDCTTR